MARSARRLSLVTPPTPEPVQNTGLTPSDIARVANVEPAAAPPAVPVGTIPTAEQIATDAALRAVARITAETAHITPPAPLPEPVPVPVPVPAPTPAPTRGRRSGGPLTSGRGRRTAAPVPTPVENEDEALLDDEDEENERDPGDDDEPMTPTARRTPPAGEMTLPSLRNDHPWLITAAWMTTGHIRVVRRLISRISPVVGPADVEPAVARRAELNEAIAAVKNTRGRTINSRISLLRTRLTALENTWRNADPVDPVAAAASAADAAAKAERALRGPLPAEIADPAAYLAGPWHMLVDSFRPGPIVTCLEYTFKRLVAYHRRTSSVWNDYRTPDMPVRFVRRAKRGLNIFEPITSGAELRKGASEIEYVSGIDTSGQWESGGPARGERTLRRSVLNFGQGLNGLELGTLMIDVDHHELVGFGWNTRVLCDETVRGDIKLSNANQRGKSRISSSRHAVNNPDHVKANTLVFDCAGQIVAPLWSKSEARNFIEHIKGIADRVYPHGTAHRIIINGLVFGGKTEGAREMSALRYGAALDKEGNISGVLENSSERLILVSTGTLENYGHYLRIRRELTEADYTRLWIGRYAAQYNKRERELSEKLDKLQREILGVSKSLGDARFMLKMIQADGSVAFQRRLLGLRSMPGVTSVSYQREGIEVFTEDFYYERLGTTRRYLGQYRIVFDFLGNAIKLQNLAQETKDSRCVTPQSTSSDSICLGSYSHILSSALASGDYEAVLGAMLEFVRDAHLGDGTAQSNYRKLPETKPAHPVAGPTYTFYQGSVERVDEDMPDSDEDEDDEYED